MFKLAKILLVTIGAICATAAPLIPFELRDDAVTPHQGAIFASLKVSSLNNILQLLAPLLPNKLLLNKEVELDISKAVGGYELNLNNATIESVSGDFQHSLTWKENTTTPTVFLDISGFDINGTLDGNVTGLPKKLNFKGFSVMNITIQLELALPQTAAQDGVHFQIVGHPNFNLGNLQLDVKQLSWQFVINKLMPQVVSGINYGLNMAEGIIEGLVWGLNKKLVTPDFFVVQLIDQLPPLNITASTAPLMDEETDLISVWLDGRFVDKSASTPFVAINDEAAVRNEDKKQMEQIFIHQSMVDSLLFSLYSTGKTIKADNSIKAQLLQIFFELGHYYGAEEIDFYLDVSFDQTAGVPVQFDTENGIEIGKMANGGLKTNLVISCTNSTTTTPEKAVEINFELAANIEATWNSFVINASISDPSISKTNVTYDLVGLDYHAYDPLLTSVLVGMSDDFNLKHKGGINLATKYPIAGFVNGLARNTIVSPNVQEDFLYAGFKWISDLG